MKSELLRKSFLRKCWLASILSGATLLAAVPAFAQSAATSQAPVTRAQVKAELEELVNAGYNPRDWYHYPQNIQAAERIVQQRHEALAQQQQKKEEGANAPAVTETSYGGNAGGKTEAGALSHDRSMRPHDAMPCSMDPQCGLYRGH
ncbi:DUF4148 domain-containing protein [Burkholderia glumae]|uniref:DUF4148 domain-containing protein n=1 Tax=Burkholderia glumae TaxID=337 RepID=A0AAP9Y507_BURGL|nr:DUF4148 domain-containing protein [Burkholderia glumae]ACR32740.1 Hypothetical protein bglu_2p0810 [Burkholderia glumae BGR1]AJY62284.1 hypothetical protein KS03_5848 [Burkholderia glumae LMG 2196 = ATCC 33617]MCM2485765.1 DUF4148 domain-containing protein [Burkholderia glumae]MCM2511603.1 DUF4148 domain-containing protein [Burkholderia glumae]MCM2541696.1 DUF4148 domain-containing protein [Burkholderia glumae]